MTTRTCIAPTFLATVAAVASVVLSCRRGTSVGDTDPSSRPASRPASAPMGGAAAPSSGPAPYASPMTSANTPPTPARIDRPADGDPAGAGATGPTAGAPRALVALTFAGVSSGSVPADFLPLAGDWKVRDTEDSQVLGVESAKKLSPDILVLARRLFDTQAAAFVKALRPSSEFPIAVYAPTLPRDVRVRAQFSAPGDRPQRIGITFGLRSDGTYWIASARVPDDTLSLSKVERGRVSTFASRAGAPITRAMWNTLGVILEGPKVSLEMNGVVELERLLPDAANGSVGLWTDGVGAVVFDNFEVRTQP